MYWSSPGVCASAPAGTARAQHAGGEPEIEPTKGAHVRGSPRGRVSGGPGHIASAPRRGAALAHRRPGPLAVRAHHLDAARTGRGSPRAARAAGRLTDGGGGRARRGRDGRQPRRGRFTVIFTRLLGADGYGSLAALLNLSVILFVPGSALQVAAAREGTLGRLGTAGELAATLRRWTRRLLAALAVLAVALGAGPRAARRGCWTSSRSGRPRPCPVTAGVWLLLLASARAAAGGARLPGGRAGASCWRRSGGWRSARAGRRSGSASPARTSARWRVRWSRRSVLRRAPAAPPRRRRAAARADRTALRALARDAALPIAGLTSSQRCRTST